MPPTSSSPTSFRVLNFLNGISGSYTVAGHHAWFHYNAIQGITGKFPGLLGEDFMFMPAEDTGSLSEWRSRLTSRAKTFWAQGALVELTFHACPPTQTEPCAWEGGIISHLTDAQWSELITNNSPLNNAWKARLDSIVPYLQDLKDNGVEVLWRPIHEMNQGAFWWGGRPGPQGTRRLYELTYDYLVNTKALTNLIWVWSVQDLSVDFIDYRPADHTWEVATSMCMMRRGLRRQSMT